MATSTTNYGLRKPATTDYVNVQTDLNANFDVIDSTMKDISDDVVRNAADIATNTEDIEQNTQDIETLDSNLTQLFRTIDVNANVTIGSDGYASLASLGPAAPSGYTLFMVTCGGISSITSKDAFTVESDGGYVYGTPNAVISGLLLKYTFIKSAVM
ncbi:MAG: hypothetical protein IKG83_03365 [Prevotella sp.]|nr:hypothetical protein [Prevotella sp.]